MTLLLALCNFFDDLISLSLIASHHDNLLKHQNLCLKSNCQTITPFLTSMQLHMGLRRSEINAATLCFHNWLPILTGTQQKHQKYQDFIIRTFGTYVSLKTCTGLKANTQREVFTICLQASILQFLSHLLLLFLLKTNSG